MGGWYHSSSRTRSKPVATTPTHTKLIKNYFAEGDLEDLSQAHIEFSKKKESGFFQELLSYHKLSETPKEFPEVEYEVKLNIELHGPENGSEPGLDAMLDGFDFPPTRTARFLKDPVNSVSDGCNYFYGTDDEEKLVVISKGGGTYLKEKGPVDPLTTSVAFQDLVMKRTEHRYPASMDEVLQKTSQVISNGSTLAGYIKKEKGEAFVLDTHDGRIYSFVISRAQRQDGAIQRQLELEYAGFIPGFEGKSKEENEFQIVAGMVDLAKYMLVLHNSVKLENGWEMRITPTQERKYDFVRGAPPTTSIDMDLGSVLAGLPCAEEDSEWAKDPSVQRFRQLDLE